MKSKVFQRRIIVVIIVVTPFLVFVVFPNLLPLFLNYFYGVENIGEGGVTLQNYGLLGDSYGICNALFSVFAFGAVVFTLYLQQQNGKKASIIDRFYKMLDYQDNLINDMTILPVGKSKPGIPQKTVIGRKAFVEYKTQLKYLTRAVADVSKTNNLELSKNEIADIAYAVFYYGADKNRFNLMLEYLTGYPNKEVLVNGINSMLLNKTYKRYALDRPNQNYLGVYFRNLYNTIKVIDSADILNKEEKKEYIKILRARLSNAELYVLFFNLISRFGKKWLDNGYIEKYELIQNLPTMYCDGYNPQDYFKTVHFEREEI